MIEKAILTLDVEDWDHANYPQLKGREKEILHLRRMRAYPMEENIDRWIQICEKAGVTSTCFVLGEFAQRYPTVIRLLKEAGHEIASHGYSHQLVHEMDQPRFKEYLKFSMGIVGELLGEAPLGFRAPSWSAPAVDQCPWYVDELLEAGFRYDSSVFPARIPMIGHPGASLEVTNVRGLLRLPVSMVTWGGLRVPFSSGTFFRLMPEWGISWGLKQALRKNYPAMVVLHPRELDPDSPRLPLSGWENYTHHAGLSTVVPKLDKILPRFDWVQCREYLQVDSSGKSFEN